MENSDIVPPPGKIPFCILFGTFAKSVSKTCREEIFIKLISFFCSMVYITEKEADKVANELSKSSSKEIKAILKKIKSPKNKRIYVSGRSEITKLLKKAFNDKREIKIRYYSPHNDEQTTRIIDVYKIWKDAITAFCHLRQKERTFVIGRISSATLLDSKYRIPKGWSPNSIILDK